MKKKLLLLWVFVPISYMTSHIVYAQSLDPSLDPLDSEVVAEDPVSGNEEDLIFLGDPDSVDPLEEDLVSWGDPVDSSEEDLVSWGDPVDPLVDDTVIDDVPWRESTDTGDETVIAGDGSVAAGDGSVAAGDGSITAGDGSVAAGDGSITAGDGSVAAGDESVAPGDETVASGDEVPTDSSKPPILGGLTGLVGLEPAAPPQSSTSPTTDTGNEPVESSTSDQSVSSIPEETQTNETDTTNPSDSSTGNQPVSNENTPEETQTDEPVLASTSSSDLIAPSGTDTSSQTNSSTDNQPVTSGSSTSQQSENNQPKIKPASSKTNNNSGTNTSSKTTTTQSSSTKNSGVSNSSNQSNSNSSTSSKNSVSSTTKVNKLTSNTSNNSTAQDNTVVDNQKDTSDNSDQSQEDLSLSKAVRDKPVVTTEQNESTTENETTSDNSNQSKADSAVNQDGSSSEISPVSPSHAQQEQKLDESDNEPEIQTTANEDKNKLTAPKPSPQVETNEESETTPVEINEKDKTTYDPVVIVANNSVLPKNTVNVDAETVNVDAETINVDAETVNVDAETVNVDAETVNIDAETFNVDAEIGPHQVFLIDIGEGYSKPTIVEPLNNSQVFIKGDLLTYVPNLGFSGIDTFSYQVIDPKGKKVVRQVRVKVIAKAELVPVRNCQLYFVNDEGADNSQFLTVSPTGKTAIKLGPAYYTFDMEGAAIDPTTGLLYATSSKGRQNIFDGYLYRVNPESGGITIIGDTGFSEISSLAFNPKDNSLWSWARKGSKDKSKSSGLIKIDPVTAQSQLVFPSKVDVEGLAWDSEGKILYGAEGTRLWAFDGQELHQQCANFSSEVESLETSVNGLLLFGTSGHNGNSVRLYDPATCEELVGDSFAIPSVNGNFDIETIAWPLECQAAITKTSYSNKASNSTKASDDVSGSKECTAQDQSSCSSSTAVTDQKTTRNSNKVTSQPATTCSSDNIAPCPTLEQAEIQQFFTDNLKADFVQIEPDGLTFVSLNGELHFGFFSYSLSSEQVKKLPLQPVYEVACERDDGSVAQLKLSLTTDVDGDGHNDFVINYCDGQAQMLFYLGINDTDDIEDLKKKSSSSNASKK
jgi:hypothetical protein